MNSQHDTPAAHDLGRRAFLKKLAAVGTGLAVAPSLALADYRKFPAQHANRFSMNVEGTGIFRGVVGYQWPAIFDTLGDMKFRVRYQFPTEHRDVLSFLIFAAPDPEDALVGEPVPDAMLISGGAMWIDDIEIGAPVDHPVYGSKPTVAMMGRIIANPIPSPFGAIVGRSCCVSAAFDGPGDAVTMYLLGTMSAGSHATFVKEAQGELHFHGY